MPPEKRSRRNTQTSMLDPTSPFVSHSIFLMLFHLKLPASSLSLYILTTTKCFPLATWFLFPLLWSVLWKATHAFTLPFLRNRFPCGFLLDVMAMNVNMGGHVLPYTLKTSTVSLIHWHLFPHHWFMDTSLHMITSDMLIAESKE